jgi:catechol 2,3-dioxygenase-like lactoylglutathione lyase family enzyme
VNPGEVVPVLRIARSTNDLDAVERFYGSGLGLKRLSRFENHDGFDGLMMGATRAPWHLEFTKSRDHLASRAPDQESLLVFYHPVEAGWREAVDRMKACGFQPTPAFNPYWDVHGVTFEDPDGYRIVLQNTEWTK